MSTFHFLRPYFVFALIPILLFWWQLRKRQSIGDAWREACDPTLLTHLLDSDMNTSPSKLLYALLFAWLIAVVILSGPTWSRVQQPIYQKNDATIVALDLSSTMLATDLHPDRITRAKYKIQDIIRQYKEGLIGLVVFSNEAFTVSPLTQDATTISNMVNVLAPDLMPVGGSNISVGLAQAQKLLQQAGFSHGNVILMADGPVHMRDLTMAKQLHRAGFNLSVLGVGTKAGAPIPSSNGFLQDKNGKMLLSTLDESGLQSLASIGGGFYQQLSSDDHDISTLMQESIREKLHAKKSNQILAKWHDQGRLFIFFLLPFALLAFSRDIFTVITE